MDDSLTFLLFTGMEYYPGGGWRDYRGRFPSIAAVRCFLYDMREDSDDVWYHIVDLAERVVVEAGRLYRYGPVNEEEKQKLQCNKCDWFLRPLSTKWWTKPDDRDDDETWKCQACGLLYHVKRDIAAATVTVKRLTK